MRIEIIIHEKQTKYYHALNAANTAGKSSVFVEFMFNIIRGFLTELTANEVI